MKTVMKVFGIVTSVIGFVLWLILGFVGLTLAVNAADESKKKPDAIRDFVKRVNNGFDALFKW